MPTLSMGRVNICRIFSPAVWAATAVLPRVLIPPCITTAPMADTEYSSPMGRPTAHNRPIHSRDGLYRGPPRPMTPARKKYQRLFSTPLRSWLRTVAQAAPATPPCRGTRNR